jgi:hypothetical protein
MASTLEIDDVRSECIGFGDAVGFPQFKGDRVLYMHKIGMRAPELPEEFSGYLPTVLQMLRNLADRDSVAYVTIDEKFLRRGQHHRRPGIHVDYNWHEKPMAHGDEPIKPEPNPDHDIDWGHKGPPPRPGTGIHDAAGHGHSNVPGRVLGGMLMAASHYGCDVLIGKFSGIVLFGGDCSEIDLCRLNKIHLLEATTYWLGALCVHESQPMSRDTFRQLVRINLHPEYDINAS